MIGDGKPDAAWQIAAQTRRAYRGAAAERASPPGRASDGAAERPAGQLFSLTAAQLKTAEGPAVKTAPRSMRWAGLVPTQRRSIFWRAR